MFISTPLLNVLMKVEQLKNERIGDFLKYCRKHRSEVTSGTIQEQDLETFKLDDNPTYVLIDEENHIKGTVSLIIDDYAISAKKGHIRIFHSEIPEREIYEQLLNKIKYHTECLDSLYFFIKEDDEKTAEILISIGFVNGGYSFTMIREDTVFKEPLFPEGFELKTFQIGRDEEDWCTIRNIGFGDEGLMSPDMVHIFYDDEAYIDGGMKILYHKEKPVGTIRIVKEYEENVAYAYIGSVCVKPEYRGKGLARNMLRAAILFGKDNGLSKTSLEVGVKNKNALLLYTHEGFVKLYGSAAYDYPLK